MQPLHNTTYCDVVLFYLLLCGCVVEALQVCKGTLEMTSKYLSIVRPQMDYLFLVNFNSTYACVQHVVKYLK